MNRLDLQEWSSRLQLTPEQCIRLAGRSDSAAGVVATEYVRSLAVSRAATGATSPTDVFIPAKGSAPELAVTRIGGVPARPRSQPWPRLAHGDPMIFVGQFCFTESIDILPPLPADLLLVFIRDEPPYTDRDSDGTSCLHFEWQSLSELSEPATEADVPYDVRSRAELTGWRYRTTCLIDPDVFRSAVHHAVPGIDIFLSNMHIDYHDYFEGLEQWLGIQIGGCSAVGAPMHSGKRCLCTFSGFVPIAEHPYPWLNVPGPITFHEALTDNNILLWYDGSTLRIYIDEAGELSWSLQLSGNVEDFV